MKIKLYRHKVTRSDGSHYYTRYTNKAGSRGFKETTFEIEEIEVEIEFSLKDYQKILSELTEELEYLEECQEFCNDYR